jgi:hypothetical protein
MSRLNSSASVRDFTPRSARRNSIDEKRDEGRGLKPDLCQATIGHQKRRNRHVSTTACFVPGAAPAAEALKSAARRAVIYACCCPTRPFRILRFMLPIRITMNCRVAE